MIHGCIGHAFQRTETEAEGGCQEELSLEREREVGHTRPSSDMIKFAFLKDL